MRTVILSALLAACAHSPAAPAPPAADPLRADLDMFCGPEAAAKATSLPELGPYVEPRASTPELKAALAEVKEGKTTIMEFEPKVRALMAKAHVASCPSLDKLMAPQR